MTFFWSFMRRVPWVVLTSHCISPNVMLLYNTVLCIIFPETLDLPSGKGVSIHARGREHCRRESGSALSDEYAPDSARAEGSSIVDEPGEC